MSMIDALSLIVPTPAEHRVWVDEVRALDVLRCTPARLAELVDAGLVREGDRYENYDVWNLGLLSGSGSTRPEREMIFFARMLKSFQADWVSTRRYAITGTVQCPRGDDCRFPEWVAPSVPDVRWAEEKIQAGRAEWRGEVELSGQKSTVRDPRVRDAWNRLVADYGFQFTPEQLALDVARTRERRVGDCDALGRVLLSDLLERGVPAELQPGYVYGGSQLRQHSWLKITDSDGQSKVLDPSMAILADMFFSPEYKAFCYGSRLNRMLPLAKHEDALASHPCAEGARVFYHLTLRPVRPGARSVPSMPSVPTAGMS